jgi:hypothetical protein
MVEVEVALAKLAELTDLARVETVLRLQSLGAPYSGLGVAEVAARPALELV